MVLELSGSMIKKILIMIGFLIAIYILYVLYDHQLGAISFFIVAVFFFVCAYRLYISGKEQEEKGNND